jgi:hypothetical protein
MNNAIRPSRRGFSLRELTTVTAVAALGAALFVPLAVQAGGESRMCVCMSRLKSISMSTARYGNDHQDAIASLQSRSGQRVTYGNPGLNRTRNYINAQFGELESAADQAIDIILRRGNRTDINPIENWVSPASYSHLALAEYDREPLPSARWACPEDATLLTWQSDPQNYNNLGVPAPGGPGPLSNAEKRWPYISSYIRGTYAWSPDRAGNPSPGAWFFTSASLLTRLGGHTSNRGDLGYRSLNDVAFPDSKVYMWDRGSRHFTPTAVYWGFVQTKQPMLFFDGATRTIRTGATARGWDWQTPNNPNRAFSYQYAINNPNDQWQPGFPNGQPSGFANFAAAHFATTREGLTGRDLMPQGPSQ